MKDAEYDFDKETDKDFLREAGKLLQKRVISLQLEVFELRLNKSQDAEIKAKLTGELLVLRRMIFDSKQERKGRQKPKKKRNKANLIHNRNDNKETLDSRDPEVQLYSDEIEHELPNTRCACCAEGQLEELPGLFEESTEFDVNTTYYILKRHKRKKYKCQSCEKIITAKAPEKLKAGSQFSVQLATKIIVDKFNFHIPLERQRKQMLDLGVNVSVKTLYSLTEHVYQLLLPLETINRQDILSGTHICLDESPMSYFNPKKQSGYVWTMSNHIGAFYQFEATRSGAVAKEMIHGFSGVVMTDGYSGYSFLDKNDQVVHVYCWAHVRRRFYDAMGEDSKVEAVVDLIDKLFSIEHEVESLEELAQIRSTVSASIVSDIDAWVDKNEVHYLKSTLAGKAIQYYLNQKEGLRVFLTNPQAPLDNNTAERRQRCAVMGRKNYLSFRSINGADVGVFFYSIIESCKTNGLNPTVYLQEMALRAIKGVDLESPYRYACRLKNEIMRNLVDDIKHSSLESPRGG